MAQQRDSGAGVGSTTGVLGALRSLGATAVGIAQTRLELLANDLEEQRVRGLKMLVIGAVALFCGAIALLLLTALIVIALWDQHRLLTLGLLAGVYGLGCAVALAILRARAAERPRMFSASLAELRRDEDALRP